MSPFFSVCLTKNLKAVAMGMATAIALFGQMSTTHPWPYVHLIFPVPGRFQCDANPRAPCAGSNRIK
jgi:hypothetical protein